MAFDRDEKLVLGRGQADRARLRLAPVHEPAQARTEGQQVLEVPSRHLGHPLTVVPSNPDLASPPGPTLATCLAPARQVPSTPVGVSQARRAPTAWPAPFSRLRTRSDPAIYIVLRFSPVANRLACPPGPLLGLPAGKPCQLW